MSFKKFNVLILRILARQIYLLPIIFFGIICLFSAKSEATEASRKVQFIALIKAIADSGQIYNPDEIAKLLNTTITIHTTQFPNGSLGVSKNCETSQHNRSEDIYRYTQADGFWFKTSPDGRTDITIGGYKTMTGDFFPKKPLEEPKLSYWVSKIFTCSGEFAVWPRMYAELQFENLPKYE